MLVGDKADLQKLDEAIDAAYSAADATTLRTFLAPAFVFRGDDGSAVASEAFLAALEPGPEKTPQKWDIEPIGPTSALVRSRVALACPSGTALDKHLRLFVRDNAGQWQLLSWLVERLPLETLPPAPAKSSDAATADEQFPSSSEFDGKFEPLLASAVIGLQSTYNGMIAVTMIDRALVEAVLPKGTHLARRAVGTTHPVIHLVGEQTECSTFTTLFGDDVFKVGDGYEEMILAIPYVVHDGDTNWHNFAIRMFLDNEVAVIGGNELYGYAKLLADIHKAVIGSKIDYHIATADDSTLEFVNAIDQISPWHTIAEAETQLPRWNDLRELLRMPFMGLRPADLLPATFICSYWELDFSDAVVAAATSNHRFVSNVVPGMDWSRLGVLTNAPDGAAIFGRVRWRLAMPPSVCQLDPCARP